MIRKWLGKGILGVGQRRGLFTPGEILVLVYNTKEDAAITVQSMRGYSIFVRFREKPEYSGLSLEELHRRALEADRRDLFVWRFFFPYKKHKITKRKGALIQAVEAIEKHCANQDYTHVYKEVYAPRFDVPEPVSVPASEPVSVSVPVPASVPIEDALPKTAAEEENAEQPPT